jgi:hypothetical protein
MGLPKKIKKNIPLTQPNTLLQRRQDLVDMINKDGTYLPKSLLHADLDKGFLDFVKEDLKVVVDGKVIPMIDILVTTQNWSQFTETWDIQNLDKNVEPPFITVVRIPEVKFGTNPALIYNIPNRRQYFYAQVPTWDGQRNGMDIYKIPQPVPVDITFQVKIVCNRMRELNEFNKTVLEKFASRQAYRNIKGHYIPIIQGNISDESVMDNEKRKYYIQSYEFTMLGFLIDENEFEVSPAITRVMKMYEINDEPKKRSRRKENIEESNTFIFEYDLGEFVKQQTLYYTTNLTIGETLNVDNYDVYINDDYYGNNINTIQINTNDVLRIDIEKLDDTIPSTIKISNQLI